MKQVDIDTFPTCALLGKPAYGRNYTTKEQIQKDWDAGLDFRNETPGVRGRYFSHRDAQCASEVLLMNNEETVFLSIVNS